MYFFFGCLLEPSDVSDEEGHADAIEIRDAMRNADAYHSGNEEDVEVSLKNQQLLKSCNIKQVSMYSPNFLI